MTAAAREGSLSRILSRPRSPATLALIPVCAAFPMDRLTPFAGIGAFGLMALIVHEPRLEEPPPGTGGRSSRLRVLGALLVIHGPLAILFSGTFDRLFMGSGETYRSGQVFEHPGFRAEVQELTADGRPSRIEFRFRVPLEDPTLRWVAWQHGRLREFSLPSIGRTLRLESSDGMNWDLPGSATAGA